MKKKTRRKSLEKATISNFSIRNCFEIGYFFVKVKIQPSKQEK